MALLDEMNWDVLTALNTASAFLLQSHTGILQPEGWSWESLMSTLCVRASSKTFLATWKRHQQNSIPGCITKLPHHPADIMGISQQYVASVTIAGSSPRSYEQKAITHPGKSKAANPPTCMLWRGFEYFIRFAAHHCFVLGFFLQMFEQLNSTVWNLNNIHGAGVTSVHQLC